MHIRKYIYVYMLVKQHIHIYIYKCIFTHTAALALNHPGSREFGSTQFGSREFGSKKVGSREFGSTEFGSRELGPSLFVCSGEMNSPEKKMFKKTPHFVNTLSMKTRPRETHQ